jgi:phosphate transport system protein
MSEKHLSSQFDTDLETISQRMMGMGALVEEQIRRAITALLHLDIDLAKQVVDAEPRINTLEMDIDRELVSIIALRQPIARDLRLLMAISKATANLERVGDEVEKVARMVMHVVDTGRDYHLPISDLRMAGDLALNLLRKALEAFEHCDTTIALSILKEDNQIDQEFRGFVRKLITYMMEDPRTISSSLDLLLVAKAIERIGDHAKNIAELVVYIVKGADIRHRSMTQIESACAQA